MKLKLLVAALLGLMAFWPSVVVHAVTYPTGQLTVVDTCDGYQITSTIIGGSSTDAPYWVMFFGNQQPYPDSYWVVDVSAGNRKPVQEPYNWTLTETLKNTQQMSENLSVWQGDQPDPHSIADVSKTIYPWTPCPTPTSAPTPTPTDTPSPTDQPTSTPSASSTPAPVTGAGNVSAIAPVAAPQVTPSTPVPAQAPVQAPVAPSSPKIGLIDSFTLPKGIVLGTGLGVPPGSGTAVAVLPAGAIGAL